MSNNVVDVQSIPMGRESSSSLVVFLQVPSTFLGSASTAKVAGLSTTLNPVIVEYFREPELRPVLRKKASLGIRTKESVFSVLDWSIRADVDEAFDAAVDLLSECGNCLVDGLVYLYLEYPLKSTTQFDLEKKLDVLINGLARSQQLSAEKRLTAISELMSSKSRIVKAAIIDALAMIVNSRNKKRVEGMLKRYASSSEADIYIQNYAKEVLEDLA
ncbi:MAG: hypothetical protein MUF49_20155 [Oculatellaceae cyanobacterium Prado106]|jgi:hypothetical protein|nr:hypothetical protein [Oculatellaceae cyanobacterium Prado106]